MRLWFSYKLIFSLKYLQNITCNFDSLSAVHHQMVNFT